MSANSPDYRPDAPIIFNSIPYKKYLVYQYFLIKESFLMERWNNVGIAVDYLVEVQRNTQMINKRLTEACMSQKKEKRIIVVCELHEKRITLKKKANKKYLKKIIFD